ncbi:hypothetical protein [Mitsuokella sp. WILCCON 0060]|uniref:hypothetical protein n=1 Tax=Mitsuokella sp. WILCCON 0060 TaxID=3345341 RepID=UPI003F1BAD3C
MGKSWWQKSLLTLAAVFMMSATAAAQSVVVDGYGTDERSALKDASRAAVEEVAGTFVDSRTLVENAAVKLDQIYTKAQGFITSTEILEKKQENGLVHLRARMDVDTNPNAQLMNNLSMVMMLNDPRIAVVVSQADGSHAKAAESALDDKLLELGFSHVAAAEQVAGTSPFGLCDAAGRMAAGQSLGADYLVLGNLQTSATDISLPDGENGSYQKTLLKTGNASLTVQVIRAASGEVVGTFTTTAKGVGSSESTAKAKAAAKASAKAAEHLEEKFRHLGSEAGLHEW